MGRREGKGREKIGGERGREGGEGSLRGRMSTHTTVAMPLLQSLSLTSSRNPKGNRKQQ